MAVILRNSGLSVTRRHERAGPLVRPVPAAAAVVVGLVVLAALSGSWLAIGVVAGLFVLGTTLLATGDEPLSVAQISSVGAVHLAAGLLLAL
jgi:hypothetical protein